MTDKPAVSETASLAAPAAPIRVTSLLSTIGRRGGGVSEAARLYAAALVADGRFELEVVTLLDPDFETDRAAWPNVPIHAFRSYGPARYGFSPGMLR